MFLGGSRKLHRIVRAKIAKCNEQLVQAARRHEVTNFNGRLILPDIVEGVRYPGRHGSEVARHQVEHLFADLDSQDAVEHIEGIMLLGMDMEWRPAEIGHVADAKIKWR